MTTDVTRCDLPPKGWACYLLKGHDGPCPTWRLARRLPALLRRMADRLDGPYGHWPTVGRDRG